MDCYTANWNPLGEEAFYRKFELYTMEWGLKEDLRDCLVAAAPYGGPIALTLLVLGCAFCLLLASARSLLLPVLALTLLLALGRQVLGCAWRTYIERCLGDDLRDIRAAYMDAPGARFWVAEACGQCPMETLIPFG